MRARTRLDGRTTIPVHVPYRVTREEMAWLLSTHDGYRRRRPTPAGTGLPPRIGQKMVADVLAADPRALDRVLAESDCPHYRAALADVERWFPQTRN